MVNSSMTAGWNEADHSPREHKTKISKIKSYNTMVSFEITTMRVNTVRKGTHYVEVN